MNDEKFEQLMTSYKESLGHARMAAPSRRPRFRALALPGGIALALAAGFMVWPRDAAAAAVERVKKAIKNAKSMRMDNQQRSQSGYRSFADYHYQDGDWRLDVRKSNSVEVSYILTKTECYATFTKFHHYTVRDASGIDIFEGEDVSALDFALETTNSGRVDIERDTKLLPGPDNATYVIRLTRQADGYEADIVVDRKSDLPIRADVAVTYVQKDAERAHFRQIYEFNRPYPKTLFEPPASKKRIDFRVEWPKLEKQWEVPLAKVETTEVRDARVTPDGTIWLLVTTEPVQKGGGPSWPDPYSTELQLLPTSIVAENGTRYARARDIVPAMILGQRHVFSIAGKRVKIIPFVPVSKPVEQPGKVTMEFAHRVRLANQQESIEPAPHATVEVALQTELSPLPTYFPALDLDHYSFQVPISLADARARAFEESSSWLEAARAHEDCARAYEGWVKYAGYLALDRAAIYYRKAGMPEEAARVTEESRLLKASRVR